MADLAVSQFDEYFKAVHGSDPFPWQRRLLEEVTACGDWPELLDLPTGTGKTAAIDIALFHLAMDSARAPRRIVLVVDRRTVVDQAFDRAKLIGEKLGTAKDGVLKEVADRLRHLTGGDIPLALAQLRGGMPRDNDWARRPDQPVIAVSTVDQVGSRLLFRGYGLSDSMRPVHAGLLGNDALLLLDEVHLAEPFRQTLEAVREYHDKRWLSADPVLSIPDRWRFVEMSATAGRTPSRPPFCLNNEDRSNDILARRLNAAKPFELGEPVKVSGNEPARRALFAAACAEEALRFAAAGRVVGVVVNRVGSALLVHELVKTEIGKTYPDATILLVTGRMRPLDRDALDSRLREFRSGRSRSPDRPPVVIVSTQCIEAGADLDFDRLVTECASLAALRQRFGRLNRLGSIDDARAVVLVRSDAIGEDPDPVYGSALAGTWRWLETGPSDFGIHAMASAAAGAPAETYEESARAPVMLPAHLDAWVQTRPAPEVDPDVSLWLHGVGQQREPEVQIVWRADLTDAMLEAAKTDETVRAVLSERIDVCAPVGLEALSIPLHAARAWLKQATVPDITDLDGSPPEEVADSSGGSGLALLWRWKGEECTVVDAADVRPGSTIIIPCSRGGLQMGTWDPSCKELVSDLGDRARWNQTRRATLRLQPSVHPDLPVPPALLFDQDSEVDERDLIDEWLIKATSAAVGTWLEKALPTLQTTGKNRYRLIRNEPVRPTRDSEGSGYYTVIAHSHARSVGDFTPRNFGEGTTEDDTGSLTGVEVTLDRHMRGVEDWATRFAVGCGLPSDLTKDIALAARWHDAGKVDRRFQRMLLGGSAFRAELASEPLAKSKIIDSDRAARRRAAALSGYPKGARHELGSVAMLEHSALLLGARDRDLVLHLVASHHGWCRPFAPVVVDHERVELILETEHETLRANSDHSLARLDSGISERFFHLVGKYGWFGLAWLETILRLADHRRSEQEQTEEELND